ncbi:mitochondrial assembly of ribosomal large subunit protein 1-like [Pseudorasbora parva]|uniref:mitochondrial assembly of ribosomal large subunit protein 1-like n=1 Tax=Pseudorasbora parva TaxID=51549 RepID=UPI00351EDCB7
MTWEIYKLGIARVTITFFPFIRIKCASIDPVRTLLSLSGSHLHSLHLQFKFLRKDEERHVRLEGRDCDDWKCIDFGPVVLHLMLPDTRHTYELEKLWTLRSHDEQLSRIPHHSLPADFIYDITDTSCEPGNHGNIPSSADSVQ